MKNYKLRDRLQILAPLSPPPADTEVNVPQSRSECSAEEMTILPYQESEASRPARSLPTKVSCLVPYLNLYSPENRRL